MTPPSGDPPSSGITNRRRHESPFAGQMVLLAVAVAVAAFFCFLYIANQPDGASAPPESGSAPGPASAGAPPAPAPAPPALPAGALPVPPAFESTNLAVQHVLVVEKPGSNELEKVVAEVPARYESGTLRWTPEQAARAKQLIARIEAVERYQKQLAEELTHIQTEWENLVRAGLPDRVLRADSPSVPGRPKVEPSAPGKP